jgi:hypothetical protein
MYLSRFANMLWFIFGCSGVVKKVKYMNVEEAVQFFFNERCLLQCFHCNKNFSLKGIVQPQSYFLH